MQEYQAIVRVRHEGLDLAVTPDALDTVTGELVDYGATAQFWPGVSEWTMTVRVPSLWDVAAHAGQAVRAAYFSAGHGVHVVRVDAWNVTEWEQARDLSE
ncbi:hypothetical protein [Streptomyces antimicrobicus]|uniref:Uncharacterized protein n=1 Tax=Streptomyces antimicrobicus TaxID=2883108 RepID=A0ABS8B4J4_9ACTN|nr:hypothetical protein [Streptomyces antimicrobicus]MCB5179525.1 hypothetical protein [Streptomyces antimicrobicus]